MELLKLETVLIKQDNVEFVVNAPYSEIVKRLSEASIGLNTMQDEHFGINVVEFMVSPASRDCIEADQTRRLALYR
jgi:alpha-1,2-mannosyltransferase